MQFVDVMEDRTSNLKITFSIENILKKKTDDYSSMKLKRIHIMNAPSWKVIKKEKWEAPENGDESTNVCFCCGDEKKKAKVRADERFFIERIKTRRIGHPYQNRAPPKRKPPRNTFTQTQIEQLERMFQHTKYLSSNERLHVAKQLKMSDSQLKTWYQNRRTKLKREINELNEQRSRLKNFVVL